MPRVSSVAMKEIRQELTYAPSPFREETVNLTLSIGRQ
jgi:hypothetical protein